MAKLLTSIVLTVLLFVVISAFGGDTAWLAPLCSFVWLASVILKTARQARYESVDRSGQSFDKSRQYLGVIDK